MLSRKPFFVGHIAGDGCAPYDFAPLFKAAVRVELKSPIRTFLLKCLSHIIYFCTFPSKFPSMIKQVPRH